jgi:hypothetical protein
MDPRAVVVIPVQGKPYVAAQRIDFKTSQPAELIPGAKESEGTSIDGYPGYQAALFYEDTLGVRKDLQVNYIASRLKGQQIFGTAVLIDDLKDLTLSDLSKMLSTDANANRGAERADFEAFIS